MAPIKVQRVHTSKDTSFASEVTKENALVSTTVKDEQ
jgi:hypothetical protein